MCSSAIIKRARPEIVKMKPYLSARSLHTKKDHTIFLDANECPFEPFSGAGDLARYPEQQPKLMIDALCRLYGVSGRNLIATRGADEAIDLLVRIFCRAGQDNIIICPPTFSMYRQSVFIQGAGVYEAPLKEDFSLDPEKIFEVSDENTKIIFLCSPNNPTGNLMDEKSIEKICLYFKDKALVVLDEAYIAFSSRPSLIPWIEKHPNFIILRTFSKPYAAAGVRCGTVIASADITALLRKVLPPYPVPQPVVNSVLRILEEKNIESLKQKRKNLLETRDRFISSLKNVKDVENIFDTEANFVLVQVKDADAFEKKCKDGNIIIRNQSHQTGLKNCVRISIGSPHEMEVLLNVLQ